MPMPQDVERKKLLAAKIGAPPDEVAPIIYMMLNVTAMDSSDQPKLIGALQGHVTPEEFESYHVKLCTGLQYAYKKFGKEIGQFQITDTIEGKPSAGLMYRGSNDMLYISRKNIHSVVQAKRRKIFAFNQLMREVKLLPDDDLIMAGVEEGYHAYQKKDPAKYAQLMNQQANFQFTIEPHIQADEIAYATDAFEVDAMPVKRQALKDLKLGPYRSAKTAI